MQLDTLSAEGLLRHALRKGKCNLDIDPEDDEAVEQALRHMQHIEFDPSVLVRLTGVYSPEGLHPEGVYHACYMDRRHGFWKFGITDNGHGHQHFLPANFRLAEWR